MAAPRLCIHSSVEGCLGCFCLWAAMMLSVSTHKLVCGHRFAFPVGVHRGVESPGPWELCLHFPRSHQTGLSAVASALSPHTSSVISTSMLTLVVIRLPVPAVPVGVTWCSPQEPWALTPSWSLPFLSSLLRECPLLSPWRWPVPSASQASVGVATQEPHSSTVWTQSSPQRVLGVPVSYTAASASSSGKLSVVGLSFVFHSSFRQTF